MCGGAIISGFIPTARSRRVAGDHLWANLKNPGSGNGNYLSKPVKSDIIDVDDDFEIDFQHFKDDSDLEFDEDELVDVKPFAFSAAGNLAVSSVRGNFLFLICLIFKLSLIIVLMSIFCLPAPLKLILYLISVE